MSRSVTKHRVAPVAFAATLALMASPVSFAQGKDAPRERAVSSVASAPAQNGDLWFVELAGRPVADGARLSQVQAEKSRFRSAARQAGVRYTERRSFDTLFNGFSVQVSASERMKLARLPGVKAMYPVEIVPRPEVTVEEGSAPDMAAAIYLTGVNVAQNQLGLSGRGIKVAIVDSGIDIDHPGFSGNGVAGTTPFPTARVVAGWDLVGDNYNSTGTPAQQIPAPDANPDDCNSATGNAGGHGTHVAGIVGANGGGIVRVAPQVSLMAYRVFGCAGTSSADIIVEALERALADGAKVINQSLGAARQWPQYPTAQASARLARKGVVMVASIGNNGPGGSQPDALFAAGAPGVGDGVIGAASFDNAQRSFVVADTPYGYNAATGAPLAPASGSLTMSRTGTTTTADDACPPWETGFGGTPWAGGAWLPAGSHAGNAVLSRRGTCAFYAKALNVQRAGAAALVLYNNAAGTLSPTVAAPAGMPAITIPTGFVTSAQGATLNGLIAAGTTTLNWSSDFVGFPFGTGGLISGFSSFGLAADLSLKPQLGAPGGGIFSTYPLERGSLATLSGTSMSAPHIAGAAALILEAIPNAALGNSGALTGPGSPPPVNMMTRMQNTAKPRAWSGNAASGLTDHAFRQGAGMLDVMAAIQTRQFVLPSQISTGESAAGPRVQTLTIRNDAASPVEYTLGHTAGVAAGPNAANAAATTWVIGGFFDSPASVQFSSPTVTVPAKGTATVTVTIEANAALVDRGVYGGYVTLTPTGPGATALVVPYAGFKGDYQTTTLLRASTAGYPWLATMNGTTPTNCPTGCSFTMADANSRPNVVLQLAHHARTLKLEAFDAVSGESRGTIIEDAYVGRNSSPATTAFFAYPWNGETSMGTQPNGDYTIRLSVLKPLGDAANPADWETWTSPVLTIARPPVPTRLVAARR